jgi:uncharacterized repeat protein (TIGR03837 family)
MSAARWDVVCRVVDNYGDAGVCWRLARQLASEHRLDVTLWIDRVATLGRFQPGVDADAQTQVVDGITIARLADDLDRLSLPAVVIEAFACGLPDAYISAMAGAATPPLWIALEYLSAEPWVETVHGLASPQPRLPLERYFWFPGFTHHTGGLLREAGLLEARASAAAHRDRANQPLSILLFCYPNHALPTLFDTWAEGDERIRCTVPEGVASGALDQWLHGDVPHAGQSSVHGRLTIDVAPFTTQDGFDRRLWASSVNFVRGEDSFVRAQWAMRPFVWQPYPQDEDAHRIKMSAFLARYAAELPGAARAAVADFWNAFNDEDGERAAAAWPAFRAAFGPLESHGRLWARALAALPDLASGLVNFARHKL